MGLSNFFLAGFHKSRQHCLITYKKITCKQATPCALYWPGIKAAWYISNVSFDFKQGQKPLHWNNMTLHVLLNYFHSSLLLSSKTLWMIVLKKYLRNEKVVNQTNTSCCDTGKTKVLVQHELFVFFICCSKYSKGI